MHFCRTARTQGINFKQQVKLFHTVRFLCGRRNGPNILPLNSLKTLQKTGFPSHIMGPLFLFWCFWVTGNNNYVGTWNCCVGFWQMRCKSVAIEKYVPCWATREMILHFQDMYIYSVISVCCFDSWWCWGHGHAMVHLERIDKWPRRNLILVIARMYSHTQKYKSMAINATDNSNFLASLFLGACTKFASL